MTATGETALGGQPGAALTVLLIEDDAALLSSYLTHLSGHPTIRVVGAFESAGPALAAAGHLRPTVALIDLGLPDMDGFDAIRALRLTSPATEVLVVSGLGSEFHLLHAIEAGASGYLLKDSQSRDFVAAIEAVSDGQSPISPALARHLLRRCIGLAPTNPNPDPGDLGLLSDREVAILERVARGDSLPEVGRALFISPHTVKTHVKNIYRKLEAHSRNEAVLRARRRGLIRP